MSDITIKREAKIRLHRGLRANLPTPPNSFEEGRPYFCKDTKELFVGTGLTTPMLKVTDPDLLAQAEAYTDAETARAEAAEALLQPTSEKGQANGYASLDSSGKVPSSELPNISSTLAGDTDVSISSPQDQQVLTYDAGTGKWENQDPAAPDDDSSLTTKTYVDAQDAATLAAAEAYTDAAIAGENDSAFELLANKDATATLGTSDTKYPTQHAVKTYVDSAIAGITDDDSAFELLANKTTDGTLAANSDTLYPSEKAVKTYVDAAVSSITDDDSAFELLANKDTSTSLGTSDIKYPSQKAVKTYVDAGDASTLSTAESFATSGDSTTLSSAESYTDSKVPHSIANAVHKWLNSYDATTETFTATQIDYSDLTRTPTIVNTFNGRSGTVTPQSGDYTTTIVAEGTNLYFTNGRVDTEIDSHIGIKNAANGFAGLDGSTHLTVVPSSTAPSHKFATAIASSGALSYSQPDYADLSGGALNITTAASTAVPSPLYSPSETPSGINAFGYIQDVNGDWHTQLGIDTTSVDATNGPPAPAGTLTFSRRTYFRDTLASIQSFKNAFVSINHTASVGTVGSNQDRALGANMGNVTAKITKFQITSNVVTFTINTIVNNAINGQARFFAGQNVVATGLSTGTYLNNQAVLLTSVSTVSGGIQTVSGAFTHADVGLTTDAGQLDQKMHAMEVAQMELDIVGSPVGDSTGGPDDEYQTLSLQCSDAHTGSVSGPNDGVGCIRAQYFRAAGSGSWGSIYPSVIRSILTNNSTESFGGAALTNVILNATNVAGSTNVGYIGLDIRFPNSSNNPVRFANYNYGLYIEDYGSNANDYAINVVGGKCLFGGDVAVSGTFSPTTWSAQAANTALMGPTSGASAAATFRALVANDYVTMVGDSGSGGTKGAVPAPASGDAAASKFLKADGTWQIPSVPASSAAWDTLTNPSSSLTLSMAGNNSTFNFTSAATWKWANTTAATSSASSSSPFLQLAGRIFQSGVDSDDHWTVQQNLATPANFTISNISETSGSVVTLTVTGHTFAVGDVLTLTGLTTGTWLNSQNVTVLTAPANSITFNDPTSHGTQASHSDTGTATQVPESTLQFVHSGGLSNTNAVQFPNSPGVTVGSASARGGGIEFSSSGNAIGSQNAAAGGAMMHLWFADGTNSSGSGAGLIFMTGGVGNGNPRGSYTSKLNIAIGDNSAGNNQCIFASQQAGYAIKIQSSYTTATSHPSIMLGGNGGNSGNFAATSGTEQIAVGIGSQESVGCPITFAPASGASNFVVIDSNPTINQTSSASGSYTALRLRVTETSLKGSSNKLLDLYAGSAGTTEFFSIDNTGNETQYTANGAQWVHASSSELLTLSTSGLTTDTSANLLPANAIIEAVVCRVTTTITTTTNWAVGDANVSNRFSSANATLTSGTTSVGLNHQQGSVSADNAGPVQTSAAKVRITCTGSNPGAGAIRITVFYRQFVAPTS